eukprot:4003873-Ditylum_brightwellii.AAC.1
MPEVSSHFQEHSSLDLGGSMAKQSEKVKGVSDLWLLPSTTSIKASSDETTSCDKNSSSMQSNLCTSSLTPSGESVLF